MCGGFDKQGGVLVDNRATPASIFFFSLSCFSFSIAAFTFTSVSAPVPPSLLFSFFLFYTRCCGALLYILIGSPLSLIDLTLLLINCLHRNVNPLVVFFLRVPPHSTSCYFTYTDVLYVFHFAVICIPLPSAFLHFRFPPFSHASIQSYVHGLWSGRRQQMPILLFVQI
uniref:Uncharacterized protein n=1 Tax=Trypanosoma vivax (strain Y486) TaxID=1055687 RepID=G0U9A7_TRYVY|nr:hypothetical protein TVY486_1116760 [Trypanosoma vivax Y486]